MAKKTTVVNSKSTFEVDFSATVLTPAGKGGRHCALTVMLHQFACSQAVVERRISSDFGGCGREDVHLCWRRHQIDPVGRFHVTQRDDLEPVDGLRIVAAKGGRGVKKSAPGGAAEILDWFMP